MFIAYVTQELSSHTTRDIWFEYICMANNIPEALPFGEFSNLEQRDMFCTAITKLPG